MAWDTLYAAQRSKNQNKKCLQFIIAANACHVTQCQLFMFECGIASNCIAFKIRANAIRLIILLCSHEHEMNMKYGRDGRLLSSTICCGSNGMFKLLLFDAMIYEFIRNTISMLHFYEPSDENVANILVELKAAENFNTIFLAIESNTGVYMNEK